MVRALLVSSCVLVACSADNPQFGGDDLGVDGGFNADLCFCGVDLPPPAGDLAGTCVDVVDDAACTTAFGSQANPYICLGGTCVPGQCHTSADCNGGLCDAASHLCTPCTMTTQCTGDPAYGAGTVCVAISGTCVAGGCNSDADCVSPQLCGLRTPNRCESCLADKECQNHAGTGGGGANTVCNLTTMACVSNACTITAPLPSTNCLGTTGTVCCGNTLAASQPGTCQSGNCCQDADCGGGGQKCVKPGGGGNAAAGVCSQCDAITGNTWFVDPQNGDDSTGVGSTTTNGGANAAPNCAFRTITRALQVANGGGAAVKIVVVGDGAGNTLPLDDTEVYPITVPGRTTISIQAGTGNVSANLPAAASGGFILNGDGAAITGTASTLFTIDGQSATAAGARGVIANSGFAGSLAYVHVQNMLGDGILVAPAATLTINAGTMVTNNGQPLSGLNFQGGVHVTGRLTNTAASGHLIISLNPLGAASPIQIIGNQQIGLLVDGVGFATVTGELATKSVEISENHLHNVAVFQPFRTTSPNPGAYVNPNPRTNLDGVYISGSNASSTPTTGSGIRLSAGSSFSLRRSRSLGNQQHGVHVTSGLTAAAMPASNVFGIDLGEVVGSLLQVPNAGGPNIGVGICVELLAPSPVPLQAHGENMSAGNCATTAVPLAHNANYACTGAKDIGYRVATNPAATTVFDVTMCTP